MANRQTLVLIIPTLLCLMILGLLGLTASGLAVGLISTRYVSDVGIDTGSCTNPNSPCRSVQYAIDVASEGDTIKVARGTYVGVTNRPSPPGYNGPASVAQVAYIDKTVTIRGGYIAPAYIDPPDPDANPTTLNALGLGRVLFIAGEISPTIEGLGITGGDASGLEGWGQQWDAGGGVYIITATATLSNNLVFGNTARGGGGLDLLRSASTISGNTISSNSAIWDGGGLQLRYSDATVLGNIFDGNTVEYFGGGGLMVRYSDATIRGNMVTSNHANGGGGLAADHGSARIEGNTIQGNDATWEGGGIYLGQGTATVVGNIISGNTAGGQWGRGGGGLYMLDSDPLLVNNVVANNHADAIGSGLDVRASRPSLLHNTIANNTGSGNIGVYVTDFGGTNSEANLTNNIVANQTVGVRVTSGSTATLVSTLWDANGLNWDGLGTIATSQNLNGFPAFVSPGTGDYHIGPTSAAIDQGLITGVVDDIDGEPRPICSVCDIGADEWMPPIPSASFTSSTPDWLGQETGFASTSGVLGCVSYLWSFGDDATSTQENPSHTYLAPNLYTVVLTATSPAGSDVASEMVTVYGAPSVGFTAVPTQGVYPLEVTFTDTSTTTPPGDPTLEYAWHFGDGENSTLPDPIHVYTVAGSFAVTLTVSNAAGSDIRVRESHMTVLYGVYLPVVLSSG